MRHIEGGKTPPPLGGEAGENPTLELERLRDQVKTLVRTEAKLHRIQNDLDHQLNIFRKLHALGLRIGGTFDLKEILSEVATFVLYELGYERCVVLLDHPQRGAFRVKAHDGYYDDIWPTRLAVLRFLADDPLPRLAHATKRVVCHDEAPQPELAEALEAFDLGELIAFPMYNNDQSVLGILVAGNSREQRQHYVSVTNEQSAYGLANLSAQAAAVVNAALGHQAVEEERNLLEKRVKERTQELAGALQDLEALDKTKSQFFANVSHELRTPLTLSIGPLEEIMKRGGALEAATRERHLVVIYRNQLRLLKLINNLLEFARIDAGQASARFHEMDVMGALRFYLGTLESAAETRGIGLALKSSAEELKVFLDRDKFERVVMNLLSNAFKFTPDGGRIEVAVSVDKGSAVLEVSDTGMGIPPEAIPRLFQRFMQVDGPARRAYEGTGIGLEMVKEYVRLHGGEVDVRSALGRGTTFTVRLPLGSEHLPADSIVEGPPEEIDTLAAYQLADFRTERDEESPSADSEVAPDGAPEPGAAELEAQPEPAPEQTATVLVADDIADMRRFIAGVLRREYRVVTARDGQEALDLARRTKPDLIVSDVMMPRLTGNELCEAIKKDPGPLGRIPVILLSAKGDLTQRLLGLDQGADDYLVKPFNADELCTRVRNLIRLRRQEQQLQEARLRLVEAERRALETELVYAQKVQASILPKEPVVQTGDLTVSGFLMSASTCSGDFWFHRRLGGGRMLVVLGDVMGHGAGSAMITELAYGALTAFVGGQEDVAPSQVLTRMNQILAEATSLWMSMAIAVLDPAGKRARFATAGNPPILYRRSTDQPGAVELLDGGDPPLGCDGDARFADHEVGISGPTRFLMYSDGLVEATNPGGRPFGRRQLTRAFARALAQEPAAADGLWLTGIRSDFEAFVKGVFEDDVTAVGISMSA